MGKHGLLSAFVYPERLRTASHPREGQDRRYDSEKHVTLSLRCSGVRAVRVLNYRYLLSAHDPAVHPLKTPPMHGFLPYLSLYISLPALQWLVSCATLAPVENASCSKPVSLRYPPSGFECRWCGRGRYSDPNFGSRGPWGGRIWRRWAYRR